MSDEDPSTVQERLQALPFAAYLGAGALTGVLAVALASLSVEPTGATSAQRDAEAASPAAQDGADVAVAGVADSSAVAGASGGGAAGAVPEDADAQGDAAAQDAAPADDQGAAAGQDADAQAEADEAATDGEAEQVDSGSEGGEGEPAGDEVIEIEESPADVGAAAGEEAEDGGEDPSSADANPAPAPTPTRDPSREAEANATPEELYDMAQEAYDEKRYKDAYRLATRSQIAKSSDRTQMLRGRAACRIKDEQNAKEIVKSFKLGDERRKTLRNFCKDRGVRVGL